MAHVLRWRRAPRLPPFASCLALILAGCPHADCKGGCASDDTGDAVIDSPRGRAQFCSVASALKSLPPIPRVLHVTFKKWIPDVRGSELRLIQVGAGGFLRANPDWRVNVADDGNVTEYLRSALDDADFALVARKHAVEQADLWRLLVVYREGGLYLDVDRLANRRLGSLLHTRMVLCTFHGWSYKPAKRRKRWFDLTQSFVLSAPGNPLLKAAVELNLLRRRYCHANGRPRPQDEAMGFHCDSIADLGVPTYFHAVTEALFGSMLPIAPTTVTRRAIIRRLRSLRPWLVHQAEVLPLTSFIFAPPAPGDAILGVRVGAPGWELKVARELFHAKREFQCAQGISTHWKNRTVHCPPHEGSAPLRGNSVTMGGGRSQPWPRESAGAQPHAGGTVNGSRPPQVGPVSRARYV